MEGVAKKFSPSEISLHSSKKDCWLIIHGKVYDVTNFLEDHPGGDEVLIHASASGDATSSFEDVGHSSTAISMMGGYLIGVVDGHDASGKAPEGSVGAKTLQEKKSPSSSLFDLLIPVLVLGLALGAWYYLTYMAKA